MDHVDQAPYTHIGLSSGIRRSALKTTLIGIATCGARGFCKLCLCPNPGSGASNWPHPSGRTRRPDACLDQVLREPLSRMPCRSLAARADFAELAGVDYPHAGE